ncbi:membrane-bound metal-dependent hydrolase [Haloterrigena turkmenica DSM 5511]|uniref:Membrane-bound metal-dependent hydrolase n=1 Tax=Haloterrigena turkmenica (strain ATCC 51198 / DSM 5511 / JCM 9101 / NCIMB 13204 / VKM B-1734 / 4k) TaxID=543526 RepID=D2RWJ2_HALTV|nr:metal-dependent hydrolase [Haloterrigena turkmenica]ADB61493.1 membrane-bound metal-dependent hydrolase [Haloterrigena turkmenica DSM 5511]
MNKKGHVLNAILLSLGLGYILEPVGDLETFRTMIEIGVPVTLGALFPDVDTAFGKHRKTLHNLPVLIGFLAFPYVFGNLEYVWLGVLTHYVLDVAGSKRGIALFYPLWKEEFGLPVGVAVSSKHADGMTVAVTVLELALVAVLVFQFPQWGLEMGQQLFGL